MNLVLCYVLNAQYQVQADAIEVGSCYQITSDITYQSGAIWHSTPLDLSDDFVLIYEVNFGCNDVGGDGLAFVLQNQGVNVVPSAGNMGYAGITPSIAVEFDTYHHIALNDSMHDHISLMKNGITDHSDVLNTLVGPTLFDSANIEDCQLHNVRIEWLSDSNRLKIYLDCNLALEYNGNIINTVFGGQSQLYFGWTGSTSIGSNAQSVCPLYNSNSGDISDSLICYGDTFTVENIYGDTLNWLSLVEMDTSQSIFHFFPDTQKTYTYTSKDKCSFEFADTFIINVSNENLILDTVLSFCITGQFNLNLSGSYESYFWSNGDTLANIQSNIEGLYSVTVSDSFGCTHEDSIDVVAMEIGASPYSSEYCLYDTVILYVENSVFSPNDIFWSTGDNDDTISYVVTGLDQVSVAMLGCFDTFEINLNSLGLSLDDSIRLCSGDSIAISANNGYASYAWSTGDSTGLITLSSSGIYNISVTDSSGCMASDSVKIIEGVPMLANYTVSAETCSYSQDGSIESNVQNSFLIDSIIWSNGLNGSLINNLDAGTYIVNIYDEVGCQKTDTVQVGLISNMQANIIADSLLCAGDENGELNVNVSNGFGAYQYAWTNGATTSLNTNLSASTYAVTITDAALCTLETSSVVWEPQSLQINVVDTAFSCASNNGGVTEVFVQGGTPDYTYIWSTGDTTSSINQLALGVYYISVSDVNACTKVDSTVITVSAPLNINLNVNQNLICYGDSIQLDAILIDSGYPGVPVAHVFQWLPTTYIQDSNALSSKAYPNESIKYIIKVTDGNLCEAKDSVYIKVNPALNIEVLPDDTICQNETIQLNTLVIDSGTIGVPAPYAYVWTPSLGLNNANIQQPLASPDTTTTYHLIVTDSNLCTATDSLTINVSPYLEVGLISDSFICYGETAALSANIDAGAGSFSFSWIPTDYLDDTTQLNVVSSLIDTMTYIINVEDINACKASDTVQINVNPPLETSAFSNPMASCNFDPVTLSVVIDSLALGTGPYSYEWENLLYNNSDSLIQGDSAITLAYLQDTGFFRIKVIDASLCESNDTVLVSINPPLNVTISSDTSFLCYGDSLYLTSALVDSGTLGFPVGHVFKWNPVEAIEDTLGFSSWAYPDTSQWFSFEVIDGNLCSDIDSIYVEVNPSLSVDAGIGDTICKGQTILLSASAQDMGTPGSPLAHAYTWLPTMGLSNPNLYYSSASPDSSITYYVSIIDMKQCVAIDSVRVKVIDLQVNLPSDTNICEGEPLSISAMVNGMVVWSDNGAGGNFDDSTSYEPTYIYNGNNDSILMIAKVVDSFALCGSNSDSILINVDKRPVANIINNISSICSGNSINLSANVQADSMLWKQLYIGGAFTSSVNQVSTSFSTELVAIGNTQCIVLDAYNYNVCPSISDTLCFSILQSPYSNLDTSLNVCNGDSLLYTNPFYGFSSVQWSDSGKGGVFGTSINPEDLSYVNDSVLGLIKLYYTLNSDVGCGTYSDSLNIYIDSIPNIKLINIDSSLCYDSLVNLNVYGAEHYTWFEWQMSWDTIADSIASLSYLFLDTSILMVIGTDSNGCQSQEMDTIDKKYSPTIDAYISYDSTYCYPLEVQFAYNVDLPTSMSVSENIWSFGNGDESDSATVDYIYEKEIGKDYPFTYHPIIDVYYTNGCMQSDTLSVEVCENVMIPNIISPNGDGRNDEFRIPGFLQRMAPCSIQIFDRWGTLVYEEDSYQNNWGGIKSNGNKLANDTYFYQLNCSSKTWAGWIKVHY